MNKLKITTIIGALLFTAAMFAESGHDDKKTGDHFTSLDINKDGSISKSEWLTKFKIIDTDNDGKISKTEMKKHHHQKMKMCH